MWRGFQDLFPRHNIVRDIRVLEHQVGIPSDFSTSLTSYGEFKVSGFSEVVQGLSLIREIRGFREQVGISSDFLTFLTSVDRFKVQGMSQRWLQT